MCGIIGYIGDRAAAPIILEGLGALEYRGYDSAGIAVLDEDGVPQLYKSAGKLSRLRSILGNGLPAKVSAGSDILAGRRTGDLLTLTHTLTPIAPVM